MTPFVERFPELGARETRSVTVPEKEPLPSGEYRFFLLLSKICGLIPVLEAGQGCDIGLFLAH